MIEYSLSEIDRKNLREVMIGFETAINEDAPKLLREAPIKLSVAGLRPSEQPLYASIVEAYVATLERPTHFGDFVGIDYTVILHPSVAPDIRSAVLHWTTGQVHIIAKSPTLLLALYLQQDKVIANDPLYKGKGVDELWKQIGIPTPIYDASVNELEKILDEMESQYECATVSRSRAIPVSPQTSMTLKFASRIQRQSEPRPYDTYPYAVANEYSVTMSRWDNHALTHNCPPTFQNELLFHPDPTGRFVYDGQYNSVMEPGQLLGESEPTTTYHRVVPDLSLARQVIEQLAEALH